MDSRAVEKEFMTTDGGTGGPGRRKAPWRSRRSRALVAVLVGAALIVIEILVQPTTTVPGTSSVLIEDWAFRLVLVGAAAVFFLADGVEASRVDPMLMAGAALGAIVVLAWDHFSRLDVVTVGLAVFVLVAAVGKLLRLIARTRRADARAVTAETTHTASIEASLDGVVTVDARGIIHEWNNAAGDLFGYSKSEAIGRNVGDLILPGGLPAGSGGDAAGNSTGALERRRETIGVDAGGRRVPIEVSVARIREDPPMFTAFIHDTSDTRRHQAENEHLAAIVRSSEDAIISRDLDGLVTVWNHGAQRLYGYAAEEAIGKPLKELVVPRERWEKQDQIDRTVLTSGSAATMALHNSKDGAERHVSLRAFPIRSEAGEIIGISSSAHDITDRLHREQREHQDANAQLWRRRIETALTTGRFHFWSQPVIAIRGGHIDHHELLLRMHLNGRTVGPAEFLPSAENSELITEIDRWAIDHGVELAARGSVAINLSARSLSNPRLIDHVRAAMEAHDTRPASVVFEITETAAVENIDAARRLVEQLREIGCGVAVDDFGTGYGSFIYLRHLPVTEIKIDMSFIQDLLRSEVDQRVVESIVMVARNFGMTTVAEGVENAATLDMLGGMGIDFAQGYHVGRPAPMERIAEHPGLSIDVDAGQKVS